MTLTAEKLPFSGDTIQQLVAAVDRVAAPKLGNDPWDDGVDRIVPQIHTTCQWEQEGYAFPCGRKAHHTCTVCEVTQCDRHDCGCER